MTWKIIIALFILSFFVSAEIRDLRAILYTEVSIGDMEPLVKRATLCRKGEKYRIRFFEGEDQEMILVFDGKRNYVSFPQKGSVYKSAPPSDQYSSMMFLENILKKSLVLPGNNVEIELDASMVPDTNVGIKYAEISKNSADSIKFVLKNSLKIVISEVFVELKEYKNSDGLNDMVFESIRYRTSDGAIETYTTYNDIRINQGIPDETFEIPEKQR